MNEVISSVGKPGIYVLFELLENNNGSVPTVYHLLNSKNRPKYFTRSYRTDVDAYDPVKLGLKVQELPAGADTCGLARFYATVLQGMSVQAAGGA